MGNCLSGDKDDIKASEPNVVLQESLQQHHGIVMRAQDLVTDPAKPSYNITVRLPDGTSTEQQIRGDEKVVALLLRMYQNSIRGSTSTGIPMPPPAVGGLSLGGTRLQLGMPFQDQIADGAEPLEGCDVQEGATLFRTADSEAIRVAFCLSGQYDSQPIPTNNFEVFVWAEERLEMVLRRLAQDRPLIVFGNVFEFGNAKFSSCGKFPEMRKWYIADDELTKSSGQPTAALDAEALDLAKTIAELGLADGAQVTSGVFRKRSWIEGSKSEAWIEAMKETFGVFDRDGDGACVAQ